MRNEGPRLVESVAEAIAIGERAGVGVQLSHHKAAGQLNVSSVKRQTRYEGMTIGAIAKERGRPLHEAMLDLLAEEDFAVTSIAHVMAERDVRAVLAHPRTMVGTDGLPTQTGKPHPRTYGTYPRVLEHYVRHLGLLSLEEAVHRMTGMVARKLGLTDRGVLAPGAAADVVVFDPARVHDRATYADPRRSPEGFVHVLVNGVWTVREGKATESSGQGRVLAKPRPC